MAEFDPSIIERYAGYLYRRATALTRGSTVFGGLFGAAIGAVPLVHHLPHWPIPHQFAFATALGGLLLGAMIGYVVGDGRAMNVRLQAQLVLHQLQLERNTAEIAEALRRQQRLIEPPLTEPVVAPVAEPVVPPRLVDPPHEPPVSVAIEHLA